jgi:hypothetical protein
MASNPPINNNFITDFPPLAVWIGITLVLVTMAQFGSTDQLAAAFAWLIFVAILLANGLTAAANLGSIFGTKPTAGAATGAIIGVGGTGK